MSRKVAICFFGITRSLSHTLPSIEANVLAPARQVSSPKIYAHFFLQQAIDNPRSREQGALDPEEHRLLPTSWLKLEEPDQCLGKWDFEGLKAWGDVWHDGYRSLRNLVHQLHSLNTVTEEALKDGAEICIFCRPDLRYHDSLKDVLTQALRAKTDCVFLPYWQAYGGLNDRFAVCVGATAIAAYGQRIQVADTFCRVQSKPLTSEPLLAFALQTAGIPVHRIRARASRVRLGGVQRYEDFAWPIVSRFKRKLKPHMALVTDRLGLRDIIRSLLRRIRP